MIFHLNIEFCTEISFYLQIMDSPAPIAANGMEPEVVYADTKSTVVHSQTNRQFCIVHYVAIRIVGRTI